MTISKQFSFHIKDWSGDGMARVEYSHETLGTIVKNLFIPLNLPEEQQRGAVIMQFPSTAFHSRWLIQMASDTPLMGPAVMNGDFVYSLASPEDNPVEKILPTERV